MNYGAIAGRTRLTIPALVGVLALAAVVGAIAYFTPGDREAGSGAGGVPDSALAAALRDLPLPDGAALNQEAVTTGGGELLASYWLQQTPDAAMAFYMKELALAGWRVGDPPARADSQKGDGFSATGLTASFVKGDVRLLLTAVSDGKDPDAGITQLHVRMEKAR